MKANIIYYEASRKLNLTDCISSISVSHDFANGKGEIRLKNGVTKIDEEAFYYRNSLKSIVIPDSVTEIGDSYS